MASFEIGDMNKVEECAICAWRKDCKKKFSHEGSGLYCGDFSKDVSLFPTDKKEMPKKDDKKG
jgi:hypothetical protein